MLICTVITLFTMGLGTEQQRQAVVTSRSGYYIAKLLEKVEPLMPAEYRQQLAQTIDQLEQRHGVAQGSYQQGIQLPFAWRSPQNSGGWTSQFGGDQNTTNNGGLWPQSGNQNGTQNGAQNNGVGGWISQQATDQFQREVLPRIEQEEARVQREIDRFLPPRTGR